MKSQHHLVLSVRIVALIICLIGVFCWYSLTLHYLPLGGDFTQDYVAAQLLVDGRSLYGEEVNHYATEIGFPQIENFHPPFSTLFYLPFTLFSYPVAYVIGNLIQLIAYFLTFYLIVRELRGDAWTVLLVSALGLFWYPFLETIGLGQSSAFIAFCCTITWVALRHAWDRTAGMFLAVAILLKLFPALALLFIGAAGRWRAVYACGVTLVMGMVLFFSLGNAGDVVAFFSEIAPRNAHLWAFNPTSYSLRSVIVPLFKSTPWSLPLIELPSYGEYLASMCIAICGAGALWFVIKKRAVLRRHPDRGLLFSLPLMLLLSPISWPHYALILLPLISVLFTLGSPLVRRVVCVTVLLFSMPSVSFLRSFQELFGAPQIPGSYALLLKGPCIATLILTLLAWRIVAKNSDLLQSPVDYSLDNKHNARTSKPL